MPLRIPLTRVSPSRSIKFIPRQHLNVNVHGPRPATRRILWTIGDVSSHVLSGVVGGFVVCGAAYAYYHFSSLKQTVDKVQSMKAYFTNFISNPKAAELGQRRTAAMTFLRSAAKSYVTVIPGSGLLVDRAFDEMDDIVDKHGEEANVIVFDAQDKIVEVIKAHDGDTAATARRISDILAEKTTLLFNLGVNTTGAPERVRQALAQADFDKVVTQAEDFAEQARFQTKRVFASVRERVTGLLSEQQRNPKAWAEKTRELGSNKWSAWKQRRSPGSGEEDSNEK